MTAWAVHATTSAAARARVIYLRRPCFDVPTGVRQCPPGLLETDRRVIRCEGVCLGVSMAVPPWIACLHPWFQSGLARM